MESLGDIQLCIQRRRHRRGLAFDVADHPAPRAQLPDLASACTTGTASRVRKDRPCGRHVVAAAGQPIVDVNSGRPGSSRLPAVSTGRCSIMLTSKQVVLSTCCLRTNLTGAICKRPISIGPCNHSYLFSRILPSINAARGADQDRPNEPPGASNSQEPLSSLMRVQK
jgi:hypothetical protein